MKILVSGSTGLVGSHLVAALKQAEHEVVSLVRRAPREGANEVEWDPVNGKLTPHDIEGLDAVVHLAGESIASRWSSEKKARIRDSRVKGTELIAATLAGLERPPQTLICASAIGYYGDRGDEVLTEDSSPANDFLGTVCQAWEAAAQPAVERGIRTVWMRFGVILSPAGGALAKMLTPFRLGVGGRVGSGQQYMSWISIDDAVRAVEHALITAGVKGPVNCVAPNPVTNQEFTKCLGRVLARPTLFPMPAFAARAAFGEMANALLLSSTRVEPGQLLASGYEFVHADLDAALRGVLKTT